MDKTAIIEALNRILASDAFKRSERGAELLKYVVTEHLEGRSRQINGATIAQDVFGRDETFDSNTDPIVRVQAGRLRQMLQAYYAGDGATDPVEIVIPKGRYAPEFRLRDAADATAQDTTPTGVAAPSAAAHFRKLPTAAIAGAAILAAIIIGVSVFFFNRTISENETQQAQSIPTGPKILVAQFEYSGEPEYESFFAKGFQIELIDRLSRFKNLFVYSDAAPYYDEVAAAREQLESAQPEFVLSGSITFAQEKISITSQLLDVSSSVTVWSETFENVNARPATISDLKSTIVSEVAATLGQPYGVIQSYMKTAANEDDVSLEDYLCTLRFHEYARFKNETAHAEVRDCLERAVESSPNYSMAWAALSWMYGDEVRYGLNPQEDAPPAFERARQAAEKAVSTDPYNSFAHLYLAIALFAQGDIEGSWRAAEQSVSLNPNDSEALASLGWNYVVYEGSEKGRAMIEKAIELNPGNPPWFHGGLAIYHYRKANYDEAYHHALTFHKGRSALSVILLSAACVHTGREEDAGRYWAELVSQHPDIARSPRRALEPWRFPEEVITRLERDLKKAQVFLEKA